MIFQISEHWSLRGNMENKFRNLVVYNPNSDVKKLMNLRTKQNNSKNKILKLFYTLLYQRICKRNNCFIPWAAVVPDDTVFPHGLYGIFISQGAVLGQGCTVFHQVTIGSNTLEDSKNYGAPEIGDSVYIGAGAKIIGAVKIGNNVRIGANACVTVNVSENSTIVSAPCRVIYHDQPRESKFKEYKH